VLPAAVAVSVVIAEVPPMLSTPVALLANEPAPARAVDTVNDPVLLLLPVNMAIGMAVTVAPLSVMLVPLNVCTGLWAVNVVALFTRLFAKVNTAAAPVIVSFQTAPLLSVTAPLNVMVRTVVLVEPKFIVPEMVVEPLTVKFRYMVSVAPVLMVSAAHVYDAPTRLPCTLLAPVVAMITESVAAGATPPTQVYSRA